MGTENVGLVPRYQDKPSSCWERSRSLGSLSQRDPGRGGSGGTEMLPSHLCSGVRAVPPAGSEKQNVAPRKYLRELGTALGHESGSTATCNMLLSITTLATQAQNKAVG